MTYDDWKPADAEDRERFMRKLYGRRSFLDLRGAVIDDYREECEADEDMGREENDDDDDDEA